MDARPRSAPASRLEPGTVPPMPHSLFASDPGLKRLSDLDAAWTTGSMGPRLRAVRSGAERLHDRFAAAPRVLSVRTLPLATLLYPTEYALWGAAASPAPYVVMTHRCLLVQFLQDGEPKNLLFNPTDVIGARRTPYLKKTIDILGEYLAFQVLTKTFAPLESQLSTLGLAPVDIDYVAFDHFHTQDVRTLIGTTDGAFLARFPRAKLIAPRNEWEAWDDVHPLQRAWFVADGKQGVKPGSVILTEGDMELGDGVWILRTPGHTVGNQTLFVNTESGIWGVSENGTSADSWSPLESKIPGVARRARHLEVDVILNTNTPEWMADQYTSMILERTLVDRVKRAPAFVQMFSSSEMTASVLAPGLRPTLFHREIKSGAVVKPVRERERAPASRREHATAPLAISGRVHRRSKFRWAAPFSLEFLAPGTTVRRPWNPRHRPFRSAAKTICSASSPTRKNPGPHTASAPRRRSSASIASPARRSITRRTTAAACRRSSRRWWSVTGGRPSPRSRAARSSRCGGRTPP
jgi:hypothetical protein